MRAAGRRRRQGDGGRRQGACRSADIATFSQLWRRGGWCGSARRGGWRAIAAARQPNLRRTKSSEPRESAEWRTHCAKSMTPMPAKHWQLSGYRTAVPKPLSL